MASRYRFESELVQAASIGGYHVASITYVPPPPEEPEPVGITVTGVIYAAWEKVSTGADVPLVGATVSFGDVSATTDADGRFSLFIPDSCLEGEPREVVAAYLDHVREMRPAMGIEVTIYMWPVSYYGR